MPQEIDDLTYEYKKRLERELGVQQKKQKQLKPTVKPQYTTDFEKTTIEKTVSESNYYIAVLGLSILYLFAYLPLVLLFIFSGNISFLTSSSFFILILVFGLFYGFLASRQLGNRTPNKLISAGLVIPLPTALFAIYLFFNVIVGLSEQFTSIVEDQFKGALVAFSLPNTANIPNPLIAAIGYYICFFIPFLIAYFVKKGNIYK